MILDWIDKHPNPVQPFRNELSRMVTLFQIPGVTVRDVLCALEILEDEGVITKHFLHPVDDDWIRYTINRPAD